MDYSEHSPVGDPVLQLPHQHIMVHAVKEFLQVHVHHPASPGLDVLLRLAHCIVRPASRPEAVAVL